MPSLTTNYSLNKPLVNNATDQDLWGGYLNDNMDTIDTQMLLSRDWKKRDITGADTVVAGDRHKIIRCDATTAAFTLAFTAAATLADGFSFMVTKTDSSAHAVTLNPNGAETIAGAATFDLSGQGDSALIVCDGTGFNIVGNKTTPSAVGSASTGSAGVIEIATTAEVQAGASSTLAVTPASMKAALGFSTYYESAEQAIVYAAGNTLTHSLGAIPKLMIVEAVCKTTDLGWAVGDRITLLSFSAGGSGTYPITTAYNATQLMYAIDSSGLRFATKTGGSETSITIASWKLVVRAWA